jgi:PleD family two-component response regulator
VLAEGRQVTFEQLFRQADAALYRAKGTGKNRYCLETRCPEEHNSPSG